MKKLFLCFFVLDIAIANTSSAQRVSVDIELPVDPSAEMPAAARFIPCHFFIDLTPPAIIGRSTLNGWIAWFPLDDTNAVTSVLAAYEANSNEWDTVALPAVAWCYVSRNRFADAVAVSSSFHSSDNSERAALLLAETSLFAATNHEFVIQAYPAFKKTMGDETAFDLVIADCIRHADYDSGRQVVEDFLVSSHRCGGVSALLLLLYAINENDATLGSRVFQFLKRAAPFEYGAERDDQKLFRETILQTVATRHSVFGNINENGKDEDIPDIVASWFQHKKEVSQ